MKFLSTSYVDTLVIILFFQIFLKLFVFADENVDKLCVRIWFKIMSSFICHGVLVLIFIPTLCRYYIKYKIYFDIRFILYWKIYFYALQIAILLPYSLKVRL